MIMTTTKAAAALAMMSMKTTMMNSEEVQISDILCTTAGAIIKDGDRKRAQFLVLGLAP